MSSSLHTHHYQVFRTLLVNARLASGFTQVQIAKKLGKPQSYVSKYENGERRLDFPEVLELADILGIDVLAFVESYRAALAPQRIRRHKGEA